MFFCIRINFEKKTTCEKIVNDKFTPRIECKTNAKTTPTNNNNKKELRNARDTLFMQQLKLSLHLVQ